MFYLRRHTQVCVGVLSCVLFVVDRNWDYVSIFSWLCFSTVIVSQFVLGVLVICRRDAQCKQIAATC